jgi:hypothetical protein
MKLIIFFLLYQEGNLILIGKDSFFFFEGRIALFSEFVLSPFLVLALISE